MIASGGTRVFALLGDPVAHSVSPRMLNAAFTALGLDAVYVALRCGEARIGGLMRALVEAGGGGNVTVPHKGAAARAVDRMEGPVPDACNVFWGGSGGGGAGSDGTVVGDNTDVAGVVHALRRLGAPATAWLVVGTGGSARAVAAAARECGARLAVRSRAPSRAEAFLRQVEAAGGQPAGEAEAEVVINATPLGLAAADPLPITPFEAPRAGWVLDLAYAPGETPLVRAFRERGIPAADGREVVIAQGAAALERWFPGIRAPVDVMRAATRAALG